MRVALLAVAVLVAVVAPAVARAAGGDAGGGTAPAAPAGQDAGGGLLQQVAGLPGEIAALPDKVKEAVAGAARDATAGLVAVLMAPGAAVMQELAGAATGSAPPGDLPAVRALWSELWWASVAALLVVVVVQAGRLAVSGEDQGDRRRWAVWLVAPVAGAMLGRLSLFIVDLLVGVQNAFWQHALATADPCLFFHTCPQDASIGTAIGAVPGFFLSIVNDVLAVAVAALVTMAWVILLGVAAFGPVYFAVAGASRTLDAMAGWFNVTVRTALVQSAVGVALEILLVLHRESLGNGWAQLIEASGTLQVAVLVCLLLALVFWWLLPVLDAAAHPVTLGGGQVLESVGRWGGVASMVVTGAGIATGNPGLIAAGQRVAAGGSAASAVGERVREVGETIHQAAAAPGSAVGGWIMGAGAGGRPAAARVLAGLGPTPSYRVGAAPGAPEGTVRVSGVPGMAGAIVRSLAEHGMDVHVAGGDFRLAAADAEAAWETLAPVLVGDGGPVRTLGDRAVAAGLTDAQVQAAATRLAAEHVPHQTEQGRLSVALADAPALRRAVTMALAGARKDGDRVVVTLPQGQAARALVSLERAGVHVESVGHPFEVTARLKGDRAGNTEQARKRATAALAMAEKDVLAGRPGYYRHGDRYVVVQLGRTMQQVDRPPQGGIFLGEWLERGGKHGRAQDGPDAGVGTPRSGVGAGVAPAGGDGAGSPPGREGVEAAAPGGEDQAGPPVG